MTPEALADLHQAGFTTERPWSAQEFKDLLSNPYVSVITRPGGFALIRAVAGEVELLTLVVHPTQRRRGIAEALLLDWFAHPKGDTAFLEVATDNTAARQLYEKHGFAENGRRKGYYPRSNSPAADALLMTRALTCGKGPETTPLT